MKSPLLPLLILVIILAACDEMTIERKQDSYGPAPPAETPDGTVTFDDTSSAPPPVTAALLERGQERYRIYCTPCHSELGDGRGMVVQRGFPAPQSFHTDRLRGEPVGYFYDVITKGYGAMYPFAPMLEPADRWAIVAYIRALQHSQDARLADVAPDERTGLP